MQINARIVVARIRRLKKRKLETSYGRLPELLELSSLSFGRCQGCSIVVGTHHRIIPQQLEFDFNRWMENEEKKTASLQKLITTNSQLSLTNSELVAMLKEAMLNSGNGELQTQIDELSRRIDRFLESWRQKRAEDAI